MQLQFTPTGGSQLTSTYSLSVDSPYKLASAGGINSVGVRVGGCLTAQSGTDGYLSQIPYNIISFLGLQITNIPINEILSTRYDYWQGNNWPTPTAGSFTSTTGAFADWVCQAQPSGTPPSGPPGVGASALVYQLGQDWYVGTLVNGSGLRVQEDLVEFYQNHGDHTGILSPAR